jgi:hypothetical protein
MKSPHSIEFVKQALHAVVLAVFASNRTSLYELAPAWFNDGYICPNMLVFSEPALRYIRSRPISLTSLSLSVRTHNECVSDLLAFISLFPRLQRLSLQFAPYHEHEHFPEFSQRLQLQGLRFLGITGVQCTDGELVALLRRHKDSLEKAYFCLVDIMAGGGSWQALLATVRGELLVPVLEMEDCSLGDERLYYRDSERDDARYLDTFEIGRTGTEDWTNMINGLVIGDRSSW